MVLLTRLDQGSAIALLLLVSAYETGDYLVGSGARNPYEGPVAGIAAITVVTFIVSTLSISAFDVGQAWLFGAAVAVLAPLGQLFASALLPAAGAPGVRPAPPRLPAPRRPRLVARRQRRDVRVSAERTLGAPARFWATKSQLTSSSRNAAM